MRFKVTDNIGTAAREEWNALEGTDNPFLRYEFLSALEHQGCVGAHIGWLPRHLLAEDEQGRLWGAVPMYLKYNSFGEFVFDWAWADAWERAGGRYYPKLVVAAPFSPVTGLKLLLRAGASEAWGKRLIQAAITLAEKWGVSSLHWLFPSQEEAQRLEGCGLLLRQGYQFHWHNQNYRDFNGFLESLTAKRRKEIRRERRQVQQQGIEVKMIRGDEASDSEWRAMEGFYRATFEAKGNYPSLTLPFFKSLAQTMGETLLLALAHRADSLIAGALYLRSQQTLYGRYWGSIERVPNLHFELCYYRGLEYCIKQGLQYFEPGAQGEHKISRGFLPTATWSAHWISHPDFRTVIANVLAQERKQISQIMRELSGHSPYRS